MSSFIAEKPTVGERPVVARGQRLDLQGLRAVAVGIVVVYHLYPGLIPAGFVGVDVFFVISGFLITGHLARSADSGKIGLLEFYGRRVRRLIPAAVVVLTATWIAARALLPASRLQSAGEQVIASALYVQNWLLAHDSVNYLTSEDAPGPSQHFWSLSVEEQFYLVWPVLFVAAIVIGRRRGAPVSRSALLALTWTITLLSLAFSIYYTATNPPAAYFVTTTRVWELGAGGLLALAAPAVRRRLGEAGWLAWLGLVLISCAALVLDPKMPFPGALALLPVVGTLLVLSSGNGRGGPARLLGARVPVFLGDVSYGIYLWHWPMIVLWIAWRGGDIGLIDGPVLIAASILLAWLMKILVEDPIRTSRFFAKSATRSLSIALSALIPIALVVPYLMSIPQVSASATTDAEHPGAAVLAGDLAGALPDAEISPDPSVATKDHPDYRGTCLIEQDEDATTSCEYGDTTDPVATIALVGDSKAGQYLPALEPIAERHHWRIITDLRSRCTWGATMVTLPDDRPYELCHEWGAKVLDKLITKERPDVVITTSRPVVGLPDHPGADSTSWPEIAAGIDEYWSTLDDAGIPVVAIAEGPEMGKDIPDCVSKPFASTEDCSRSRSAALPDGMPMSLAAEGGLAELVNWNDVICGPDTCPAVEGNVLVYRDKHHLTNTYVRTMEPYIERALLDTTAFGRLG